MSGMAVLRAHEAIRGRVATALKGERLLVVDLGGARVSCLVAEIRHSLLDRTLLDRDVDIYAALRVVAAADAPAAGMKGGTIEDVEAVSRVLGDVLREIRRQLGRAGLGARAMPDRALFALSGGSPRTLLAAATTGIPVRVVDDATVGRVMAACRQEIALRIRRPLHIEPLDFSRNDVPGIADPRGLGARTLGVRFGIVTVERGALERLNAVAKGAGLAVSGVACAAAASGFAALTQDELDLGATVVDIGAQVTGVASFRHNRLRSVHCITIGGATMTRDLASAMDVSFDEAEAIKTAPHAAGIAADPSVLGGAGPGEATLVLTGVIRPRVEEMFELVRAVLPPGEPKPVILTGGGSRMRGMVEAGSAVLGRRVRLGRAIRARGAPQGTLGPEFATVHGLLAHAVRLHCEPWADAMATARDGEQAFGGLRQWLRENW